MGVLTYPFDTSGIVSFWEDDGSPGKGGRDGRERGLDRAQFVKGGMNVLSSQGLARELGAGLSLAGGRLQWLQRRQRSGNFSLGSVEPP